MMGSLELAELILMAVEGQVWMIYMSWRIFLVILELQSQIDCICYNVGE
jgi:hypothetical protein